MGQLEGQVAIVTGAGTGIGAATVKRFTAEGAKVVLVGRRREKLEESATAAGSAATAIVAGDVREQGTAEAAIRAAEGLGGLDVVVSNAAWWQPVSFPDAEWQEWRQMLDIILMGSFHFSRHAAQAMIARKTAGRIINVTSIHGTQAERNASSYGAAKAAVNQFTRCLAVELAPHNIRANAVAPGFVATPMSVTDGVDELESEWFKRNYVEARRIPMARAAQPEEIASAILFLASGESSYLTGHVMVVDGGLTCTF